MPASSEILETIRTFFDQRIPFNAHLGLKMRHLEVGRAVIGVAMRPEFIGDISKNIAHGGLLAALIDVAGGATAFTVLEFPREMTVNTVDMRVDYLRPGHGCEFTATGSVVRKGSRICVTRVEVHNDAQVLVAHGIATYSILARSAHGEDSEEFASFRSAVGRIGKGGER